MMEELKQHLWSQFAASIDMLRNAIQSWPDEKWNTDKRFFYVSYHTVFFLECYLHFPGPRDFSPKLPFISIEKDRASADAIDPDLYPARMYTKQEILDWLNWCREECRRLVAGLTEAGLNTKWTGEDEKRVFPFLEMMLYNMRHVQHHTGQLNAMISKAVGEAPRWVRRATDPLQS